MPLLTPVLFALVIAPALKQALHTSVAYESFVAIGTIGLLIPLNRMFAGLGVIVDRESGAQRELLAAPVPRRLLVLGNLVVAFAVTALQVVVLIGARRRPRHARSTSTGDRHRVVRSPPASLFTVGMYGVAETLASRVPRRRSTSRASPRSRSCRGSSPARCSRSARCRGLLTWIAQGPAADPRAGADALRAARRQRPACTTSGACTTPTAMAALEPRRRGGLRRRADGRLDPRVHPVRSALTCAAPALHEQRTRLLEARCETHAPAAGSPDTARLGRVQSAWSGASPQARRFTSSL